jgi:hypothetical protein
MLLFRRWLLRTVGLWLAKRGYRWWQRRRVRAGMAPTTNARAGRQVTRGRRRGRIGA